MGWAPHLSRKAWKLVSQMFVINHPVNQPWLDSAAQKLYIYIPGHHSKCSLLQIHERCLFNKHFQKPLRNHVCYFKSPSSCFTLFFEIHIYRHFKSLNFGHSNAEVLSFEIQKCCLPAVTSHPQMESPRFVTWTPQILVTPTATNS